MSEVPNLRGYMVGFFDGNDEFCPCEYFCNREDAERYVDDYFEANEECLEIVEDDENVRIQEAF